MKETGHQPTNSPPSHHYTQPATITLSQPPLHSASHHCTQPAATALSQPPASQNGKRSGSLTSKERTARQLVFSFAPRAPSAPAPAPRPSPSPPASRERVSGAAAPRGHMSEEGTERPYLAYWTLMTVEAGQETASVPPSQE